MEQKNIKNIIIAFLIGSLLFSIIYNIIFYNNILKTREENKSYFIAYSSLLEFIDIKYPNAIKEYIKLLELLDKYEKIF